MQQIGGGIMAEVRERIRSRRESQEAGGADPWANRIAAIALLVGVGSMVASYGQYVATQRSIDVSRQIANEQLKFAERVVRDNNKDTQDALALTRQLAGSANQMAGSSNSMAKSSNSIAGSTSNLADWGAEQAAQSGRVADSSLESSQTAIAALNESVANFRRQFRAYLDLDLTAEQDRNADYLTRIPFRFTNYGASPARNVIVSKRMWVQAQGSIVPDYFVDIPGVKWEGAAPFGVSKSKLLGEDVKMTNDQRLSIRNRQSVFVVQAVVDYEDILWREAPHFLLPDVRPERFVRMRLEAVQYLIIRL